MQSFPLSSNNQNNVINKSEFEKIFPKYTNFFNLNSTDRIKTSKKQNKLSLFPGSPIKLKLNFNYLLKNFPKINKYSPGYAYYKESKNNLIYLNRLKSKDDEHKNIFQNINKQRKVILIKHQKSFKTNNIKINDNSQKKIKNKNRTKKLIIKNGKEKIIKLNKNILFIKNNLYDELIDEIISNKDYSFEYIDNQNRMNG